MFKKKLSFICLIVAILFSSVVYANDDVMLISDTENSEEISNWIDSDINSNDKNYLIDTTVVGNAFINTNEFIMNSKNNGGLITGNLFVIADSVKLKSDVIYSTKPSEDGSYDIESINSASIISGNTFILANTFILEPGSEIDGDLYVIADTIELQEGSLIRGNVFAKGSNLTINSSIGQSLYASCKNFNMNSDGFVYRDMNISANTSNIDGEINRNAYADVKNLSIGSNFSVSGNFEYSSQNELQLSKDIVIGEIKYTKSSDDTLVKNILSIVLGLLGFVFYILVIALFFKYICNKNSIEYKDDIDLKFMLKAIRNWSCLYICSYIGNTSFVNK